MFIENKYSRWYHSIIQNAEGRRYFAGSEEHHIMPTACGGKDTSENRVFLTKREHYVCHRLLPKCLKSGQNRKKMMMAFWWISHHTLHQMHVTSRKYQTAKQYLSESKKGVARSKETRDKISQSLKTKPAGWGGWVGRKHTEAAKEKMSQSASARMRLPTSEETKMKISQANKGRKRSPEVVEKMKGREISDLTKQKMSLAHTGKPLSDKHRQNVSAALKGKPWSDARRAAHQLNKHRSSGDLDLNLPNQQYNQMLL